MAMAMSDPSNTTTEEIATAAAASSPAGFLGHHMHKNRLQEYTQRLGLSLPSYSTFNEGEPHAPRFRATVLVDEMNFTSPYTFSQRKQAEQDVAKLAFEIISKKSKNEASLDIHKDPTFCKLILNEYEATPIFITTITFEGKTYRGFAGRSKEEAEKNAACVVIDSILANSKTAVAMAQIIKEKGKLFEAVKNIANVGNATLTSEIKGDDADGFIEGTRFPPQPSRFLLPRRHHPPSAEEIATAAAASSPVGNLPTGPTSCVPSTSQLVDNFQSNQMNFWVPSLGLPSYYSKEKEKEIKKEQF